MGLTSQKSEHRTVAVNQKGRTAIAAALEGNRAARAPGAALEHARQRQLLGADAQRSLHQRCGAVEQRQSQRAPLDHEIRPYRVHAFAFARVAQVDYASIEIQAAIAVFREASQRVSAFDAETGGFQRLEQ